MIIADAVISLIVLVGAFFLFVGSLGLAKLPDLMRRLHGPTKATTLGIGSMLIGSMLYFWAVEGNPSIHEPLITLFLVLTAPVTAQMIAKAHILRGGRAQEGLPGTGRPVGWATLDAVEADERSEVTRTPPNPRA
ncbi:Na+/H+ antiporter subunit G [Microvirga makkahensis]|uniref:Na+/H+ antiporter subunit G n=1 Tax=Microvirga makkahensis TaxID=1128670 RepID=A0A7X3MWP6_9HYPH|nr:Na+/H+ antiporter subunit G [Microvirga makkahensis]MXQ14666.1 Na+/H+ antiporter subunit G [Microvirga makkahensis]